MLETCTYVHIARISRGSKCSIVDVPAPKVYTFSGLKTRDLKCRVRGPSQSYRYTYTCVYEYVCVYIYISLYVRVLYTHIYTDMYMCLCSFSKICLFIYALATYLSPHNTS